ncbi:preprotein translocase subunit SecG [Pseudooctadecabacter jejudonensis]|uniref:Protein-export membrane protein SecG n=1 Tax=Pseudooctadecabacter jejudonensis TaxID=1391910 RepID=A0A1Y5RMM3_9RHOB|nr:preprotein translocase subunit SecG [Pseudooctadecabacter jejudonensis]SLN21024.1 preprotein translocase subunit SecG [Pseudooctadecabacter jejudonensis]
MENVVLVVHLLLALALIGVVLLQRSEGGGLGIGGGGGGGGAMTGRAAATALGKVTWLLAIAFICTSVALTILSASQASDASVVDGDSLLPPPAEGAPAPSAGDSLLPPSVTTPTDEPLVPDAN